MLTSAFPAGSSVEHSMQLLWGTDFQYKFLHFSHGEARSRSCYTSSRMRSELPQKQEADISLPEDMDQNLIRKNPELSKYEWEFINLLLPTPFQWFDPSFQKKHYHYFGNFVNTRWDFRLKIVIPDDNTVLTWLDLSKSSECLLGQNDNSSSCFSPVGLQDASHNTTWERFEREELEYGYHMGTRFCS